MAEVENIMNDKNVLSEEEQDIQAVEHGDEERDILKNEVLSYNASYSLYEYSEKLAKKFFISLNSKEIVSGILKVKAGLLNLFYLIIQFLRYFYIKQKIKKHI